MVAPFANTSSVSLTSPSAIAALNNNAALLMPKTRIALAAVRNGTRNARFGHGGDSTTFGVGSNGTNVGDLAAKSYVAQLSAMLNNPTATGLNAHRNSFCGDQGVFQTLANDGRVTSLGSFTQSMARKSLGGAALTASASTPLTFAPGVTTDTINVWGINGFTTQSNINVAVNGITSPTTVSQNGGTQGLQLVSKTVTSGTNVLNVFQSGSPGGIYLVAAEMYDSTKKWVSLMNAGWSGAVAADLADTTDVVSPGNAVGLFNFDTFFLNIGINDWVNATSLTSFAASVTTIVTNLQAAGVDVVIMTPLQSASSSVATATQQGYVNVLSTIANAKNCVLLDLWSRNNPQSTFNSALYYNGLHHNGDGYNDDARAAFDLLMNL